MSRSTWERLEVGTCVRFLRDCVCEVDGRPWMVNKGTTGRVSDRFLCSDLSYVLIMLNISIGNKKITVKKWPMYYRSPLQIVFEPGTKSSQENVQSSNAPKYFADDRTYSPNTTCFADDKI